MAALKVACPKCRNPLQITQALPAKTQCPSCRKVFTVSGPKSANSQGVRANANAVAAGAPVASMNDTGRMQANQTMSIPTAAPRSLPVHDHGLHDSPPKSGMGMALLVLGGFGIVTAAVLGGVIFAMMGKSAAEDPGQSIGDGEPGIQPPNFTGGGARHDPRVTKAVASGVAYLKKRIESDEKLYYFGNNAQPHVGAMALGALTLLECGVPHTDPAVKKAINEVHAEADQMKFTYSIALSILFLDRLVSVKEMPAARKAIHKNLIRMLALRLIANQHPRTRFFDADLGRNVTLTAGGWEYNCQKLTIPNLEQLLKNKQFPTTVVQQRQQSIYRDNSIGQFVLLALWNARKHGVTVAPTLLIEEERYLNVQNKNGSWYYRRGVETAADATTCAGLIGLAVGRAIRDEVAEKAGGKKGKKLTPAQIAHNKKLRAAMDKGLQFIGKKVGKNEELDAATKTRRHAHTQRMERLLKQFYEAIKDGNSARASALRAQIIKEDNDELATGILFNADAWGDLYFLWSVERVAVIYGKEKIGGKDWYNWGKEIILKVQEKDGSWRERFPGVPDTCFALLFLKRANVVKDLSDKLKLLLQAMLQPGRGPRQPGPARRDA